MERILEIRPLTVTVCGYLQIAYSLQETKFEDVTTGLFIITLYNADTWTQTHLIHTGDETHAEAQSCSSTDTHTQMSAHKHTQMQQEAK